MSQIPLTKFPLVKSVFPVLRNRHEANPKVERVALPSEAPYCFYLEELPQQGSVTIPGMREVGHLPQKATEFFVHYGAACLYFHSEHRSKAVEISYAALGSVLRAEDFNKMCLAISELQEAVNLLHAQLNPVPSTFSASSS